MPTSVEFLALVASSQPAVVTNLGWQADEAWPDMEADEQQDYFDQLQIATSAPGAPTRSYLNQTTLEAVDTVASVDAPIVPVGG